MAGSEVPRQKKQSPTWGPGGWLSQPRCAHPVLWFGAENSEDSAFLSGAVGRVLQWTWWGWKEKWHRNRPLPPRRRQCHFSASSCWKEQRCKIIKWSCTFVYEFWCFKTFFFSFYYYNVHVEINQMKEDSQIITSAISKPPIWDKAIVIFVNCNDNNDHDHGHAPADQRELQHVAWYVAVKDFHQSQVHVDGLQSHPGEGDQQEVVKEPGCGNAKAHSLGIERQPRVHQEDQVEQQQSQAQVDQDFRRYVLTQLPTGLKRNRTKCECFNSNQSVSVPSDRFKKLQCNLMTFSTYPNAK